MARVKSVRALLDAAATMKANPETIYDIGEAGCIWPPERWTWADFRRWFIKCLQLKINRHDGRTWRKFDREYQRNLRCDADVINDYARRVMRRGLNVLRTPEMRRRYPHINNNPFTDY
jgi:hypothetical protein